jgi:hypothetical protein
LDEIEGGLIRTGGMNHKRLMLLSLDAAFLLKIAYVHQSTQIEYYQEGQRKRERLGPNKGAAEQRLREVLSGRAEGRHIKKSPDIKKTLKDLTHWYLDLAEVKAKRS